MKPPRFAYHDPTTVAEAVDLTGRLDNALVLAGGQSLMPMLNVRVVLPDHLIDLNRIPELSYIAIADGMGRFGAMTRQRDLEFSPEMADQFPIMVEALAHVGHRQTRNRGTFGGSLCHLDPSAELVNMAALHDGVLEVTSSAGSRQVAIGDWVAGVMTNALAPGEILTGIVLKAWPSGHGYAFEEFARRHGDFAIAAVGCLVTLTPGDVIARAAVCISGFGAGPIRLSAAEKLLAGQAPSRDLLRAAAAEAEKLQAEDDAFVSAAYRRRLAGVLTGRALARAIKRASSDPVRTGRAA
jgi:carbon-monoxide dehydrogenase medium subunit